MFRGVTVAGDKGSGVRVYIFSDMGRRGLEILFGGLGSTDAGVNS